MTGCLVYLMGASGSGKDSILQYARKRVSPGRVIFPRRAITRPAEKGGEDHIPLTPAEFQKSMRLGEFSLWWKSHGLLYGISGVEDFLEKGRVVVINGSRGYFPTAATKFPGLLPVEIRVDQEILKQRLLLRGREDGQDIKHRLKRAHQFSIVHPRLRIIENSGPLAKSGEEFVRLLQQLP